MSKCYASAVLAIAAAEIGYHEKKSNSQLGNPTANAGSAATSAAQTSLAVTTTAA